MRIWFVDAFTDKVFTGNTAAVVPLTGWLPDEVLQAIAAENRCSETAFFAPTGLKGRYQLRWFTPQTEVPLCGHATLAAGAILLTEIERELEVAVFDTQAGVLVVGKTEAGFTLDMPRRVRMPWTPPAELVAALGQGVRVVDGFVGEYATIVLESEASVRNLKPDIRAIERLVRGPRVGCLAVTAMAEEGKAYDFVSRFFAPGVGLPEDPVTGSSFADLVPYWCDRLDRTGVTGYQASARGGAASGLQTLHNSRLLGQIAVYLRGELDPAVELAGGGGQRQRPAAEPLSSPVAPVIPTARPVAANSAQRTHSERTAITEGDAANEFEPVASVDESAREAG